VSDLNTNFDKSTPEIIPATVTNLYYRVTRTRKGGTTTTYYLEFKPASPLPYAEFPTTLRISSDKYRQLGGAKEIEFKILKGYLGCPWVKSIDRTDF